MLDDCKKKGEHHVSIKYKVGVSLLVNYSGGVSGSYSHSRIIHSFRVKYNVFPADIHLCRGLS